MPVPRTDVRERMVYKLVLRTGAGERVFDVGRTFLTVPQRMHNKRTCYNSWLTGYVNPKTGKIAKKCCFCDLIKKLLGDKKWTYKNLPQVQMKAVLVDMMDGFQAELMEGYFQKIVYPECLNVQIGDGHGKSGGSTKRHFGCISWNKTCKVFQARFSLPKDRCAKRYPCGQRKPNRVAVRFKFINEAYDWVLASWAEHKDQPDFAGYKPPKTLDHYKNHLGNRYEELAFLLSEN